MVIADFIGLVSVHAESMIVPWTASCQLSDFLPLQIMINYSFWNSFILLWLYTILMMYWTDLKLLFDCVIFGQQPVIYSFFALTPHVQLLPRIRQSARGHFDFSRFCVGSHDLWVMAPSFHSWWQEAERAELRVSVKNKPGGEDEGEKETRGRGDDKESGATPVEQMFVRRVKKIKNVSNPRPCGLLLPDRLFSFFFTAQGCYLKIKVSCPACCDEGRCERGVKGCGASLSSVCSENFL